MRNLIQLFLKYGGFFLFLFLEGVCFYLIVNYNQDQRAIYINSVNNLTSFADEKVDAIVSRFYLSETVDSLAKENAYLNELLLQLKTDQKVLNETVFTEKNTQQYAVIDAKVIKNSIRSHHNQLVLNRGSKDGVQPHSAVISKSGIVGIVRYVSTNFSIVMSVLNRQSIINAKIKEKGFYGPLTWESMNPRIFSLKDIEKQAPVLKGDTVVTSGYSAMFPEGIMIGTIDTSWIEPGSNSRSINVLASNDMSNIQYVYVVTNLKRSEQLNLEQEMTNE